MRAYKKEIKGNLITWFYKKDNLLFEIDRIKGNSLFTIGNVNNNYWLNVVDNTPTKTKQTLINRLLKNL